MRFHFFNRDRHMVPDSQFQQQQSQASENLLSESYGENYYRRLDATTPRMTTADAAGWYQRCSNPYSSFFQDGQTPVPSGDHQVPHRPFVPPRNDNHQPAPHHKPDDHSSQHNRNNSSAEQVVDRTHGVSAQDKERAKTMTPFEQQALALINNFRREHNLAPVQFDPRLQLIALIHSKYQNAYGLGHNEARPGWQTVAQRMAQVGLRGWRENAGYGAIQSPLMLVNMWINSPGHRAALLDPNMRIAGLSKYGSGATLDLI